MIRIFSLHTLLATLFVGAAPAAAADESFKTAVAPFLAKHCVACHGESKQESGLRLDKVDGISVGNRTLWTLVHERVSAGEMPPKEHKSQPTPEDTKKVLTWIGDRQRELGPGGTRRLNRRELAAALRDVTGLNLDFALALPGDGSIAGFDTGADALQEASDAVAQWLQITRRAVDGIRFLEEGKGKTYSLDFRKIKDARQLNDLLKNDGLTSKGQGVYRPGTGLLMEARAVGERETFNIVVPLAPDRQGIVRLTIVVSAYKPMQGLPNSRLWITIGGRDFDFRELTGTAENPQKLVYEAHVGDLVVQSKGLSIHIANKVEVPYKVQGFENEEANNTRDPAPDGTGLYRPAFDRRATPPEKQPVPFAVLQSVEIDTDYAPTWPPVGWESTVKVEDNAESAKKLLKLWTERAWRRPVTAAETKPFEDLYTKCRGEGMSFDESLRAAFQSVLLSAPFRYQASPGHPDATTGQYAIASRLSFMLTGGPPDAELKKLAAEGKLRDPKVLDAQVDRLVADPRSQGFFRPFVFQWLEMDQPITYAQTYINKQDFRFGRYFKSAMKDETVAYVTQLFTENRPAKELVQSDWTMMNDALAIHYGYPPMEGGELRKVKLRADDPRGGGIISHAGLQSMLCWMGDNWVIYRGAWALRKLLDSPPPPPPLEVPELSLSDEKNKGKPYREVLRMHQEDSRCSVCHKTIDPVGFAFQNFDISGRWRDVEHESYARGELDGRIAWRGVGATRPVDSVGNLPRGEAFKTYAEFKNLLSQNYQDDLVRGIMKNLYVYATGRTPGIDDLNEIKTIMKANRQAGYPLRDMLKAVVRSPAFLEQSPTLKTSTSRQEK